MRRLRRGQRVWHATMVKTAAGRWVIERVNPRPLRVKQVTNPGLYTVEGHDDDWKFPVQGSPYKIAGVTYRLQTLTDEQKQKLGRGLFDVVPEAKQPKGSSPEVEAMRRRAARLPRASYDSKPGWVGYDLLYTTALSKRQRKGEDWDPFWRRNYRTALIYMPIGTSPQDAILAFWKLGTGALHKQVGTFEVQVSEETDEGKAVPNAGIYQWRDGRLRNLAFAKPSEIKFTSWKEWQAS